MKDRARELLMRGFSTPMIAKRLDVSQSQAARLVRTVSDDWEPSDRYADTWRGARARAATLLIKLGLTYTKAAAYMNVSRRAVYNYVRQCEPAGQPLIRIGLTKKIEGRQRETIDVGEYRLLDFGSDVGMVRLDKSDGAMVHFVDSAKLKGNFTLLSESLYEVTTCQRN